jgi:AraC family transcriptional regulator
MQEMLDKKLFNLDFNQESITSQILPQPPLLSSHRLGWRGVHVEYHHQPPHQIPEFYPSQHLVVIHTEIPSSIQSAQMLNGQFSDKPAATGDTFIVPANIFYQAQWDSAGSFILIGLEPTIFARTIYESIDPDRVELLPHLQTPDQLIYQLGLALKSELETDGAGSQLYAETMTNALIVHLLTHYSLQKPTDPQSLSGFPRSILRQIIDYINDHLDRDLSLVELAALAHISPTYFASLFKQATGWAPHQYVIYRRIECAKQLLCQGELSIAEISAKVGFANPGHFSRHFKKLVGVTPKTLRQRS